MSKKVNKKVTGDETLQATASDHYRTRRERFRKLAAKRVPRVLKQLQLLGNLASPAYAYTDEELAAIIEAAERALNTAKQRFHRGRAPVDTFKLPEYHV